MAIRLLIFDLDGTLVDSAQDIVDTTNFVLEARGEKPLPREVIVAAIGEGLKKLVYDLFPETHADPAKLEALEADFYRAYEQHLLKKTTIYPGVEKFLSEWTGKIAIVTNKYEKLAHRTVDELGLGKYNWLRVFGAESLPKKKPDPLPLLEVMRLADCRPEETLMIGDGIPDMVAASRAGVHAIACEFGYSAVSLLKAQGASLYLKSYEDLQKVISDAAQLPPRQKVVP